MKFRIYDILKVKSLIDDDAIKNWRFIVFLIILAIIMIANSHNYEKKIHDISNLTIEVKELRSEFVDGRSELMKIKMESTIAKKMGEKNIFPSEVPPKKIKVIEKQKDNNWKWL